MIYQFFTGTLASVHRHFRFLLLAALTMGAIAPSSAQAAVFTNTGGGNTIITGLPDGTETTAHHVINFPGDGTFTCNSINFQGTASNKEFAEMTVTVSYNNCTFRGALAIVNMRGCDFLYRANGGFKIASIVEKECAKEPMEISITGCTVKLGEQEFASGILYHPLAEEEGTLETKLTKMQWQAVGVGCPSPGQFSNGEYETGNAILTSESDDGKKTMKPFGMDTP